MKKEKEVKRKRMNKLALMLAISIFLYILILPLLIAQSQLENATSIYECTEGSVPGTCNLVDIQYDDISYEQFRIGNNPTQFSRINVTVNTTLPANAIMQKVEVCIAAFRDSILGDDPGDKCEMFAGENASGMPSYTVVLPNSLATCLNWSSVWGDVTYICRDITDWISSKQNPKASAEKLLISWRGNESVDNNVDLWIDWMYANISYDIDNEAPHWSSQSQNNSTFTLGAAILLSAYWTDNFNLSIAILSTNETGSWANKTGVYSSPLALSSNTSWSNFTWQNASVSAGTVVGWRVWTNDSVNNWNVTNTMTFTIIDNAPNITLNQPQDNYYNDTSTPVNITFNCSASDNVQLKNISLFITNSSNQSFSLNQTKDISGTANESTWTLSLNNGNYTWNCLAYDNASQFAWGINNRTVKINYTDTTAPIITIFSPLNMTYNTSTLWFNATADELINKWIANYNGTNVTLLDINTSFGVEDGSHHLLIYANDSAGNWGLNNTIYFTVDLCTPDMANTSWGDWSNLSCVGNQMNQSRSLVQYDSNFCNETGNVTFYEYQLVGPSYQNTSWSDWTNISCLPDNKMNQSRNLTQYDIYGCASNQTFTEYRNTEYCDATAPIITNVINSSTTNQSTLIEWTTNESANSSIIYGINLSMADGSNSSATLTTLHSLKISGLTNNTLYYYNVTSCDSARNCNTTGPYNFTTAQNSINDTTAPIITSVRASGIANSSAYVEWETNESSNSTVDFGTTQSFTHKAYSSSRVTSHEIKLTNLTASKKYYYNVTSCDAAGNCNSSGPWNFTTSASGGSGGGSGGSGSNQSTTPSTTPAIQPKTRNISTELEQNKAVTVNDLSTGHKIYFEFSGQHYIEINSFNSNMKYVEITLHSLPISRILLLNKVEEFDLNADNENDISVTLMGINPISLVIKLLVSATQPSQSTTQPTEQPTECPACQNCSNWTECVNGTRNRTCYNCSAQANFTCQAYEESKKCFVFALPISALVSYLDNFFSGSNTKINYIVALAILGTAIMLLMVKKFKKTFRKTSKTFGFEKGLRGYLKKQRKTLSDLKKKAPIKEIRREEKELSRTAKSLIGDLEKTEKSIITEEKKLEMPEKIKQRDFKESRSRIGLLEELKRIYE